MASIFYKLGHQEQNEQEFAVATTTNTTNI